MPIEYKDMKFKNKALRKPWLMVFSVSVDKAYRRHGLANKLMTHIHSIADIRGTDLFLITSMAQPGAAALYSSLDYDEDRWLITENSVVSSSFTDIEKIIYGSILGFFEYGFYRKNNK